MDERLLASVLATVELAVLRMALLIDATGLELLVWDEEPFDVNDLVSEFNFEFDHKFPFRLQFFIRKKVLSRQMSTKMDNNREKNYEPWEKSK